MGKNEVRSWAGELHIGAAAQGNFLARRRRWWGRMVEFSIVLMRRCRSSSVLGFMFLFFGGSPMLFAISGTLICVSILLFAALFVGGTVFHFIYETK
jgi:hypothetical protein